MRDFSWSPKEKQIARAVFERAALAEEKELLDRFKVKAASLETVNDLWALQVAIRDAERTYQGKYDFRYSQLPFVFGNLLRENRLTIDDLQGLGEEKLEFIRRVAFL